MKKLTLILVLVIGFGCVPKRITVPRPGKKPVTIEYDNRIITNSNELIDAATMIQKINEAYDESENNKLENDIKKIKINFILETIKTWEETDKKIRELQLKPKTSLNPIEKKQLESLINIRRKKWLIIKPYVSDASKERPNYNLGFSKLEGTYKYKGQYYLYIEANEIEEINKKIKNWGMNKLNKKLIWDRKKNYPLSKSEAERIHSLLNGGPAGEQKKGLEIITGAPKKIIK